MLLPFDEHVQKIPDRQNERAANLARGIVRKCLEVILTLGVAIMLGDDAWRAVLHHDIIAVVLVMLMMIKFLVAYMRFSQMTGRMLLVVLCVEQANEKNADENEE